MLRPFISIDPGTSVIMEYMKLTSPAFEHQGVIPTKYTQWGEDINPQLHVSGVPEEAVSLVLIMDDPDVPDDAPVDVWDHWVVFNIPSSVAEIPEHWGVQGVRGIGTRQSLTYSGPKPPDREHRYFFKLYALDAILDLPEGSTKSEVEQAMQGQVIEQAELIGRCAPQNA